MNSRDTAYSAHPVDSTHVHKDCRHNPDSLEHRHRGHHRNGSRDSSDAGDDNGVGGDGSVCCLFHSGEAGDPCRSDLHVAG